MIERFKEACHEDARIIAALMFGSFAIGEGDEFSISNLQCSSRMIILKISISARGLLVSPVAAYFPDDFGHHTALFENGIRGEFHLAKNRTYRSFPLGKATGGFLA